MEECPDCVLYAAVNDSLNNTANTTSINKFYFYQSAQLAVLWALLVAIVAGNTTVVLALLLNKTRKSRMNFFIMQLAIADLLVGLISVLPDLIQRITITWFAGSITCKVVKYLQGVVTYSSTYVLVALSVDRCDAITHPMNFTGSWRRARALIVAAWFISFAFCVPMLILFDKQEVEVGTAPGSQLTQCWARLTNFQWRVWVTSVFVSLFVVPAVTISACYGVIVVTIRQKSRRVLGKRTTVNRQYSDDLEGRRASSRGIIPKAKIKTVKMTFVIVFVFVLCWSPYMIFDLLQVYQYIPDTQSNVAIASLIQSLAPLNSAANPVIYFIFSNRIFVGLRNIPPYKWLWCWMKGGESPAGNESRAHTELLTSSHRRTRHDLTVKEDSLKFPKQRVHSNSTNSKKVRLHLPDNHQMNNNCHAPQRREDTFL
ncbi:cardioacceleratory peptide receptor-like isoform X2 [Pectinophora gossypiella]|uniref:cardioacceleratory peptide receptor-like isoform X2 n=1 Tax=Pectinophora gossypiella TaxID=13191 RepID=UPI00214E5820|nr:cardioacceleratory peptide receptor-like isoform X2 [Pectinophora gossypiella]